MYGFCWGKTLFPVLMIWILLTGCSTQSTSFLPASTDPLELIILYVNDTHSHIAGIDEYGNATFSEEGSYGGFGRIAAAILQAKENHDNVLALDAGDQFQGTLYYSVNRWPMLAELSQHMPYDAMTLGNHEFDEGCSELSQFLDMVPFPIVAANIVPEPGCPLRDAPISPYVIRIIRGKQVAIIGLANNDITLSSACERTGFKDAQHVLQETVNELTRKGIQHIIVLTHLGLPADRELARSTDGIDVIVGGHTHSYLGPDSEEGPYPIVEKSPSGSPVLIVTARNATLYLGKLKVRFDEAGIPVSWSGGPQKLLPATPANASIDSLIQKYTTSLEAFRQVIVGYQDISFPDGLAACRKTECLGGMVTADAMLEYARPYGASMALCNGGAIRAGFPKGDITRGDLLAMHPFENRLVLCEYSGRQILEALEHGVAGEKATGPRLLQVAGLRYVIDSRKPVGKRIVNVELLDTEGAHPLDMEKHYGVILLSYLARGGGGYAMLKGAKVLPSPESSDVAILESYLRKHSPLSPPSTGRIIRLGQ